MIKKSSILILFVLTFSLTSFSQTSTVYFYRLKEVFLANTPCIISVNDTSKITLDNGSFQVLKTEAETLDFITSISNNVGIKNLKLEKGKTYYIKVDLQTHSSINLVLTNEFTGKPAIERLEADSKSKDVDSGNLNLVKITSVAPIPPSNEGMATIYLYRPFNIAGIAIMLKVSDGESLYEFKNNSSHIISTLKSEINLISVSDGSNTSNTSLKLKLEKGKVYYVAVLKTGGAVMLTETKEDYAKKEMKIK